MEWMCVATYLLNAESINACRCGVANKSRTSLPNQPSRAMYTDTTAPQSMYFVAQKCFTWWHTLISSHTTKVFTIGERPWCRRRDFS